MIRKRGIHCITLKKTGRTWKNGEDSLTGARLELESCGLNVSEVSSAELRFQFRDVALQDELHIVIRKQLSSNSAKYKWIGVIGALMIVRNIAFRQEESSQARELSDISRKEVGQRDENVTPCHLL